MTNPPSRTTASITQPCATTARVSATLRLGQVLFRFRSFTPIPVLAVLAWLLWRGRGAQGPLWLEMLGLGISLLGQGVRFYTVSQVSDGTSGQDDVLEAR